MSLEDWLQSGWLAEHRTSREEIRDLLSLADRDLSDCQTPGLSSDWWLSIAYNAGLQLATAALAAAGFRASREAHHLGVIHSLAHTIGAEPKLVNRFDRFRKKRNVSAYDRAGAVSDREAEEMALLARELRMDVEEWLRARHPELLSTT